MAGALEIIRDGRRFPRRFGRPTVALGNFDGVHLGHQALFDRLHTLAAEVGGEALAYTFEPHPVAFFFPDRPPFLLTTLEQKLELVESCGVRTIIVATFDADFASQTPEVFARDVLVGGLGARVVVVGYDFTFGKGRAGTPQVLEALGRTYGFRVEALPPITVGGEPVSSSRIRRAVAAGLVEDAATLLGRPYTIRGTVVPGHRRGGTQLGFPTANVRVENPLVPGGGVYAAWVRVLTAAGGGPGARHAGSRGSGVSAAPHAQDREAAAVNVGTAPTFGGGPKTVEAHLLDFRGDLYGARIEVALVARLREERRFGDLAALKGQIAADVAAVRALLT